MIQHKIQKLYHVVHDRDHLTKQSILDYLKEIDALSSNVKCHQKLHIDMIVELNNYFYSILETSYEKDEKEKENININIKDATVDSNDFQTGSP